MTDTYCEAGVTPSRKESTCPVLIRRSSVSGRSNWFGYATSRLLRSPGNSGSPIAACATGCARPTSTMADKPGLSSDERAELVALRRKNRVLELEVEILKRASAYFARENVLPK